MIHLDVFVVFLPQGVDELLGGNESDEEQKQHEEEDEGSAAQSIRSPSPVVLNGQSPTPDLLNTDGTLILFPGNSCSRTGYVCSVSVASILMFTGSTRLAKF